MLCDEVFQMCVFHLKTAIFSISAAGIVCISFLQTFNRQHIYSTVYGSDILQESQLFTVIYRTFSRSQDGLRYKILRSNHSKESQTILGRHRYYRSDLHWRIHYSFRICSNSSKTTLQGFGTALGDAFSAKCVARAGAHVWHNSTRCDSSHLGQPEDGFHAKLTLLSSRPCRRTGCSFTLIRCSLRAFAVL